MLSKLEPCLLVRCVMTEEQTVSPATLSKRELDQSQIANHCVFHFTSGQRGSHLIRHVNVANSINLKVSVVIISVFS